MRSGNEVDNNLSMKNIIDSYYKDRTLMKYNGKSLKEYAACIGYADIVFNGVDLRSTKADYSGANFSGCSFEAARFDGVTLNGVRFVGAILSSATFVGAQLRGANFKDALMDCVDLTDTANSLNEDQLKEAKKLDAVNTIDGPSKGKIEKAILLKQNAELKSGNVALENGLNLALQKNKHLEDELERKKREVLQMYLIIAADDKMEARYRLEAYQHAEKEFGGIYDNGSNGLMDFKLQLAELKPILQNLLRGGLRGGAPSQAVAQSNLYQLFPSPPGSRRSSGEVKLNIKFFEKIDHWIKRKIDYPSLADRVNNFSLITKSQIEMLLNVIEQKCGAYSEDVLKNTIIQEHVEGFFNTCCINGNHGAANPLRVNREGAFVFPDFAKTNTANLEKYRSQIADRAALFNEGHTIKVKKADPKKDGGVTAEIESKTTIENTEKWDQIDFLITHLRLLVQIFIQFERSYQVYLSSKPKKLSESSEDKMVIKQVVVKEIWITLNALLICRTYRDVVSDDRLLTLFLERFVDALSDVAKSLLPAEVLVFPCGTKKHAVYLSFVKMVDSLIFRLDNLGEGVKEEARDSVKGVNPKTGNIQFQLTQVAEVNIEDIKSQATVNTEIKKYLRNICLIWNMEEQKNANSYLYNSAFQTELPPPKSKSDNLYGFDAQKIGNCVAKGFSVGILDRLYNVSKTEAEEIYHWLIEELEKVTHHNFKDGQNFPSDFGHALGRAKIPSVEDELGIPNTPAPSAPLPTSSARVTL